MCIRDSIDITDVLEVLTVMDGNEATNSIDENSPAGTVVSGLGLVAQDESNNALSSAEWSITDVSNAFVIDLMSGAISLASNASLDYEGVESYIVSVEATGSKGGETLTTTLTLTIAVTNVLETLTVSDEDGADNTIAENATVGTAISGQTLTATGDADVGTLTWSLPTNPNNTFAINSTSGAISLATAGVLDYETAQSYVVVAQAESSGIEGTLMVTITVTNVLETLTIDEGDVEDNTIAENATVGTAVSGLRLLAIEETRMVFIPAVWSLTNDANGVFETFGSQFF